VKRAVPVSLGDNAAGFHIVGTSLAYPEIYGAKLQSGQMWSAPMEVVLGSEAARVMELTPGATFIGQHGLTTGGDAHGDKPYRVTGILAPTGAVIDRLILTDTASMWKVHEEVHPAEAHGEAEHATDAVHDGREVTALLVTYRSMLGAVMLPREVSATANLQPAVPAIEVGRLNRLLGSGGDVLQGFGAGLLVLAGFGFVLTLATAVGQRAPQLALLRVLGARPAMLFSLVTIEALLLGLIAGVTGVGLGWAAAMFAAQASATTGGPVLALSMPGLREVWILAGALAISLVAALGPAISAYRTDPARVLKGG
jgi:putative ABC transport system permease protein